MLKKQMDHFDLLNQFGFSDFFKSIYNFRLSEIKESQNCIPALVINQEKDRYKVLVAENLFVGAIVPGRWRNEKDVGEFPAVGDWVVLRYEANSDVSIIEDILDRKSFIYRKSARTIQPIAANVDYVFILSSLNQDLNTNRIERYLTMAWDSGAVPVVVLSKKDLVDNYMEIVTDFSEKFVGVDIIAISYNDEESLKQFEKYFSKHKTAVVVGSSGVGKSTLINHLVGEPVLKTSGVREDDDKGRHTTTSRSMWKTIYGGLVIDTPGMRELALADSGDGLEKTFEDIFNFASQCKFGNCLHETEPGCAVLVARESGEIDDQHWKNFLKLRREMNFERRKVDKAFARQERMRWRKIHMEHRQRKKVTGK